MPAPTTVITGTATLPDGSPAVGLKVNVRPARDIIDSDGTVLVPAENIELTLNAQGEIDDDQVLVPSNADATEPVPYFVQFLFGDCRNGYVEIPADGPFDLLTAPLDGYVPPGVPTALATAAALAQATEDLEAADTAERNRAVSVEADLQAQILTLPTDADVQVLIDAVVNGAPGTLDTLNEIAAALGDDPNLAATLTGLIAAKATPADITEAITTEQERADNAYQPLTGATPLADTINAIPSHHLLLQPSANDQLASGVTVKRVDDEWGADVPYGSGQSLVVLSPSTQDASDETGDGQAGGGDNPVLLRLDPYGALGLTHGIHVAPGLRKSYGGGDPAGIWVQLTSFDTFGLSVTGPNPAIIPAPVAKLSVWAKYDGTKYCAVEPDGSIASYFSDGTTKVAQIFAGALASGAYRAQFTPKAANVGGVAVNCSAGQTAPAVGVKDSTGKLRGAFTGAGDVLTFADDGTTPLAATYAGTTPPVGIRQILLTGIAGAIGQYIKGAGSQSADLVQHANSAAAVLSAVNAGGTWVSRVAAGGIVLKDTQTTPHYWRVTISNTGVLTTTDLGTTVPTS